MTLDQIGLECKTDKSSLHHDYLKIYEQYFSPLRDAEIHFVEIGYGGYQHYNKGGNSARMWRQYFSHATITVADLFAKAPILGVRVLQGSQDDANLIQQIGKCDVFIDDASHHNNLNIITFNLAWPYLNSGGIYVVEDIESSYGEWANGCEDWNDLHAITSVNYFRKLTDEVNKKYIPGYIGSADDKGMDIEFIHFWRNCIIIKKK